ncbi:MAG: FG-GAP-like repeat-containing protein [Bacteroidota bacterium]|nr:FG-GAP-like repeat-containing protein [Bacteroidota bacterium]
MQIRLSHVADVGGTRGFDTEMLMMNLSGGTLPGGVMVRESPTRASTGRTSVRTTPSGYMFSSFFDIFTEISLDGGATWTPASEPVSLDFSSSPPSISVATNNFPPDGMDFTPPSYGVTTFENGAMIRNTVLRRIGISEPMPDAPLGVRSSVSSFFDIFTEVSLDGSTWSPSSNVQKAWCFRVKVHDDAASRYYDTEMYQFDAPSSSSASVMLRESPTRASTGRVFPTLMSDGKFQVSSFFDIFTEISLDGGATWSPATTPTHIELTTATPSPRPVITSISPSTGPVGTIITITGSGFSTVSSENLVTLGDNTPIIKGSTLTELRVVLTQPISPLTGGVFPVSVKVGGLSNLPPGHEFTILPNIVSYLPNISDLTPLDVQTGDLDGDGLDEIIMLGKKENDGHVTVLKQHANGTQSISSVFSFPELSLDSKFTGLLDADCDDDGIVDYVALNVTVPKQTQGATFGEKILAVFQNDPASRGRLKPYRRVLLEQDRVLSAVALDDVTGDDSLDVVCAYEAGDGLPASLQVIKNIPGGGAATAAYAATGLTIPLGSGDCNDFAFADLDGDGDLDIVCATDAGLQIFQNNQASFEFLRTQTVDETHPYSGVATGDIDGDGHADVVALRSDSGIVNVCFGDPLALGSVKSPREAGSGMATGKRQHEPIKLSNVDGDGDLDIICPSGESNQTVSVLLLGGSLPGGAIISARLNMDDCDDQDSDADGIPDAKLFAVGKFDTDQDCDFAFTSCRSTTISPPVVSSFSPDISPAGALVTIEGDNLSDVQSVHIGDYNCDFRLVEMPPGPPVIVATVPLAARTFAAPHILEKVMVTSPSGACVTLKSITVSPALVHMPPQLDPLQSRFVLGGDMDGDGKGDIVALSKYSKTGHVTLMKRSDNGSSSRAMVTSFFDGKDDDCDGFAIGDLDGDGLSDVCVALTSRSTGATNFELLFGDSSRPGMFRESPTKVHKQWMPANFRLRTMAPEMKDIDGDGKPDIVFAIQGTTEDTLVVITNPLSETDNTIRKRPGRTKYSNITLERSVAAGSSFFDIFVAGDSLVDRYSWSGGGGGAGGSIQLAARGTVKFFNTSKGFRQLAVGDLDGDGSTDAVVFDTDSSVVTVCLDKGDGTFRVVVPRDPPSGQSTGKRSHLVVTDLDGDGRLDIAIDEPGAQFAPAKSTKTISDFTYQKIEWTVLYNRTELLDTTVSFESKTMAMDDWDAGDNNVAVCDLDGDGVQDLVVTGASSSVVRPPFIDALSASRIVAGRSVWGLGGNLDFTTKVEVCGPCENVPSFSAVSDSELAFVLPPSYGDKFLTISNADGSVGLASPITILAAPDMFVSVPPESLMITNAKGAFVKPVKRGKKLYPNWANLLEEVVVQGGFQPSATESDQAGGLRVGISHITQVAPGKWKPIKDSAAVRAWVVVRGWNPKKNAGKNWSNIQKTLRNKDFTHTGIGRGLDSTGLPGAAKRKMLKGELKVLDPKKTPNKLFAELVALKFNIAASQLGKTPVGFGELVFDDDASMLDEMSVLDISKKADVAMTYTSNPLYDYGGHDGVNPLYEGLYEAVHQINRACVGPLDTASFEVGRSLTLDGAIDLATVPFLKFPVGLFKPRILLPTTSLTESIDDIEGMDDVETLPVAAKLYQNYPNPFNPTTSINFGLKENSIVSLKIYNTLGQQVATLLDNETVDAGNKSVEFDASQLSSGVYFYRLNVEEISQSADLNTGSYTEQRKMILLK